MQSALHLVGIEYLFNDHLKDQAFSFKVGQAERVDLFLLDLRENVQETAQLEDRWHPVKDQWITLFMQPYRQGASDRTLDSILQFRPRKILAANVC